MRTLIVRDVQNRTKARLIMVQLWLGLIGTLSSDLYIMRGLADMWTH
jgi:hypothetical protein